MIFFFSFLGLGLFVSLFCLYHISREDFVFIKRNVTLEDLFNITFIIFFVGLLFSRVFYVVFHFAPGFFNPLVFFLIPYYPGLSFMGGVIGGVLALLYITKKRKLPIKRILDFVGLSFLAGLPVGFVGSLFLASKVHFFVHLFLPVLFFVIFLVTYLFVYPRVITKELKPGMLGTSVLIVTSFVVFFISMISHIDHNVFFLQPEDSLSISVFVLSLGYFMRQELFVVRPKR